MCVVSSRRESLALGGRHLLADRLRDAVLRSRLWSCSQTRWLSDWKYEVDAICNGQIMRWFCTQQIIKNLGMV